MRTKLINIKTGKEVLLSDLQKTYDEKKGLLMAEKMRGNGKLWIFDDEEVEVSPVNAAAILEDKRVQLSAQEDALLLERKKLEEEKADFERMKAELKKEPIKPISEDVKKKK